MAKVKDVIFQGANHNVISANTTIKGEIYADEDFRIDGKIEGNIQCKGKVVTGPHSKVTGTIHCLGADLMGEFEGDIRVEGNLMLRSSLILNGNVIAKSLEIEPGAVFNGSCVMK
ncbi:polymer-forming cytoskeletal protein [Bacteroidales bacterium OttesenSCG-928-J19]|nr:polymer-forming cytoskeletal protein [Bacteroidales bacterium OttesenSCG-928-J19]